MLLSMPVLSQNSVSTSLPLNTFEQGKQFFNNRQYSSAIVHLKDYLSLENDSEGKAIEANYYILVSNLKLDRTSAAAEITAFADKNSESYFGNQAYFELAKHIYKTGNFKYTYFLLSKVDDTKLDKSQMNELLFKKGYCLIQLKEFQQAEDLMYEVKNSESIYRESATYYYAHIQYEEGNYATALADFLLLEKNPSYSEIIPFYLTQLYHVQKDYEKVLTYGPNLLAGTPSNRTAEISRIVGDAYYAKEDYKKAVEYLEQYKTGIKKISRPDIYHLGLAYYKLGKYEEAAVALSQIATSEDELTQNTYGFLADCYLKLNDKNRARMSFEAASKLTFDKVLQEEALYNYAKLTYETAYSPFNETITAFENFLELFPESQYRDETYDLLANVFMTTQNYERAYQSILKIKSKDSRVKKALQRVAYYRAIELFSDNKLPQSITYFNVSLNNGHYDKELKSLASYWRGEAYYRLGNYDEALSDLNQFITLPGAFKQKEFGLAHYNMGYAFFKKKNYSASINWFRKFVSIAKNEEADMLVDAYNRTGDCYFLKRDFKNAQKYFSDAVQIGGSAVDYSLFKKAYSHGLLREYRKKISDLKSLLEMHPESPLCDDAWFELGKTWTLISNSENAIASYAKLTEEYPQSSYAPKGMLNMALVHYNSGNASAASDIYKKIVTTYSGTPEGKTALASLKNISVDQNNVAEYIEYTKSIGGSAKLNVTEEDSLTYVAAEKLYMSGNILDSKQYLQNYITKFPNGGYLINANFYLSDCLIRNKEADKAIPYLNYIASQPRNMFTEEALVALAEMYQQRLDLQNALEAYTQLLNIAEMPENIQKSKIGILRSNYDLNNAGATILASNELIKETNLSPELMREALYKKAKSFMVLENNTAAKESFALLANDTHTKEGAEAKYLIAEIYYKLGKIDDAENEVFDFISKNTSHQYWLAKAFVLLSRIYLEKDDAFQAKQYLLSVKDNYTGEDDVSEEMQHLLQLIQLKEDQQAAEKRDTLNQYFIPQDTTLSNSTN